MKIEDLIKNIAREKKIDLCGIMENTDFLELKHFLLARKEKNQMTEFEEQDLDLRLKPSLTMESCKSIIVLGLAYKQDSIRSRKYNEGVLSKSSYGLDYHLVLRDKIEALTQDLSQHVKFDYRYYVDTGPLIDRRLGEKSGLGFIGKNTSLINEEFGSYFFIGYILIDLDLEPDQEVKNDCGTCSLCVEACPAKALNGDYTMDAKKCISYLTQKKSLLSEEERRQMGTKIYGCDTCQIVCPKNKFAKNTTCLEFYPKETEGYINIEELYNLSNREFKSKYGKMAGAWRGKKLLLRNGIINLANSKDERNLKFLESLLDNSQAEMKEYIIWALRQIENSIKA